MLRIAVFSVTAFVCAAIVPAQARQSDAEIRKLIVGSWIVPPDSSDYMPSNEWSREVFSKDGTYVAEAYQDAACKQLKSSVKVQWNVIGGVLISIAGSQRMNDKVDSIDDKQMTLTSLEDKSTYTRKRSETCAR